ncbi:MAG TPA: insulinase family protein [Candidatus Binatia bacterium]|nr:insulinase family protein [Candidatus Binatia bacterium]
MALGDTLRLDARVRTGVLPNGLHYFIRANHKPEARVSLRLAVDIGSTAEAEDQRGLAHFNEHMNFNGSAHFKPDELVSYLQSIGLRFGADANAYTSFDQTVYSLDVPTDRDSLLVRGVTALSDFAGRATLTDPEIDKERGVVLEEWRLGLGSGERIRRKQFPVLFHGSRYADRLPIGLPEVIEKAPHDRLRAFYHDWYTPDHMAVIAVGDIDPAKMERLIREHFGDLKRPAQPRPAPVFDIPPHDSTLVAIATDPEATASSVTLGFKSPHEVTATVGDYRRDLVRDLYFEMLNERFDEIAHRADPPFLNAGAGGGMLGRTDDLWELDARVKDGGVENGLAALLEETARVRAHGFLPLELQRAKDRMRANWERIYAERDKSESADFAREYVSYFLVAEPAPGIEAEYAIVKSVLDGISLAEINAVPAQLMRPGNRVVLVTAPSTSQVPDEAALRAVIDREAKANPVAWVDSTAGKQLMAKRPAPGRVKSRRTVPEIGATVVTLSNGVQVWLKPTDFKADEIVFSATSLGGASLADSADYAAAALAGAVIGDAGVGGFTSTELDKVLAGRIARVGASYGDYTQGISGSTRLQDLETALQLTYLTFTQPTRDPDGFAAFQKRTIEYLKDRANNPQAAFSDTIVAVNEGGLYLDRVPTVAQVEALKLDHVLAFHKQRFGNAADFTFAFAGNFKVDAIVPLLARYLGALPSRGRPTSHFAPRFPRYPTGNLAVQVHKGLEPKSSTRITYFTTGAPIEELDMHRARACASILTDHLRQTLRELMGGTYSAGASYSNLGPVPGYATMTVSFGSDPARVDTLVQATLSEIQKLRDEGPSAADVQKDQEIERRELDVALQQNGVWTGSILTSLQLGIDPRRIAHRRERIGLLTIENLRDTFRKYFPANRRTVISLLPEVGLPSIAP